jgi:secretion/DNA translocation related TadE-like protein
MRGAARAPATRGAGSVRQQPADSLSGDPEQGGDHGGREKGVATVYACLGIVVLFALTGLAVHLGAAVIARQRAETGADLSALAGAAKVLQGPDRACAAVVVVAAANRVELQSCTLTGTDVLVMVVAHAGAGPFSGSASARARAGPVQEVS